MLEGCIRFLFLIFIYVNVEGKSTLTNGQMPRFSWDTLPVAYHGSNTTAPIGMYNPESLKALAKFSIVTLEKYQGVNGMTGPDGERWDDCQNETDVSKCGCCTEDNIVAAAIEIKKIDPTTMVIGYWHANKEYPIYRQAQLLCKNPDWWARDENGDICYSDTLVYWNHAVQAATDAWADGCLAMTNTGYIDGCFMDGCTTDPCTNDKNPDFIKKKEETIVNLQAKTPGPLICGSTGTIIPGVMGSQIQNWGKPRKWSTREIPMIMRAVNDGVMFQAHVFDCPEDPNDPLTINNLSAFLIGAGKWSYYMCGTWTNPPLDWYPIYDFPLGEPLSNATLGEDGIWRRSFATGTNVTFDTNKETGKIDWPS